MHHAPSPSKIRAHAAVNAAPFDRIEDFRRRRRRDDGGYTLTLWPAFEDYPSRDATADTARVIAGIETMVRAAPAQYLWIPRRFKRQPAGSSVY